MYERHKWPKIVRIVVIFHYRTGNRLKVGKVVQTLINFQHEHQGKLLCWTTSMLFHKGSVGRDGGVKRAHLLGRGSSRRTGVNRSLNRGHTPPLSDPQNWLSSGREQSNGSLLASYWQKQRVGK